jgi:hypothetical protein
MGTKKKTSVGLLVLINTVLYNSNCCANVFGFFKPVNSISYSLLFFNEEPVLIVDLDYTLVLPWFLRTCTLYS